MEKSQDLRAILSQNIRKTRTSLHISQAKLAEYAKISVPHLLDIEYCKTWVSDKTLNSIARVLNMEAYELLMPEQAGEGRKSVQKKKAALQKTAELINAKKRELRKKTDETMNDLIFEIIKVYEDADY